MNRDKLSIIHPDDWHLHLRDHAALATTVPHTARCFRRAIVMPNLNPPVTTVAAAGEYRGRILASAPARSGFEPLMTLYLTDELPPAEIDRAAAEPWLAAVKYYPAGATTNSESGVTAIEKTYPTLERMQELGVPLLMHGEVNRAQVDIFDREAIFIDEVLEPLIRRFPGLPMVLEHITTRESAEFVTDADARIGATITVHHLLYHRSHMLAGGIRPHLYCLPILKRDIHREALRAAATSGNPRFFLGTDSAPHRGWRKGKRLWLRRRLHGPRRAGTLCRSIRGRERARPARSLRRFPWAGFLWHGTQQYARRARARKLDRSGTVRIRRR